jgi:hypothetical protein
MAEEISRKLDNGLKSLGTVVSCFTPSTHFSKDSFESTEILVTTVIMWRNIVCTLGKRCKIFFKCIFCSNKGHSHIYTYIRQDLFPNSLSEKWWGSSFNSTQRNCSERLGLLRAAVLYAKLSCIWVNMVLFWTLVVTISFLKHNILKTGSIFR